MYICMIVCLEVRDALFYVTTVTVLNYIFCGASQTIKQTATHLGDKHDNAIILEMCFAFNINQYFVYFFRILYFYLQFNKIKVNDKLF